MPKYRATLKKDRTNKDGYQLVMITYSHQGRIARFSTAVSCNPKYFNGNNQDQPISKGQQGYTRLNKQIKDVKDTVSEIMERIRHSKMEPEAWLVKELYHQKEQEPRAANFFELFDQYISDSLAVRHEKTIRAYKVARRILRQCNPNIRISGVTLSEYDGLVRYMARKDYSNNYIGTIVKRLKSFLRYARKEGYNVHPDLDRPEFKVLRETPTIIYLSQSEFESLRDLELLEGSFSDKVRDLAILGCRTGLRISDLSRLGPQHFQNSMIVLRTHKTKSRAMIPMSKEVRQIAEKWGYNPPKMADQVFNREIKKVAEKAGITTPVEVVRYSGGSKSYRTVPKWELVSSHVMVKTFITHCGERGISAKTVSEITGKSVKVILQHYYGTSKEVIKTEMERAFG